MDFYILICFFSRHERSASETQDQWLYANFERINKDLQLHVLFLGVSDFLEKTGKCRIVVSTSMSTSTHIGFFEITKMET